MGTCTNIHKPTRHIHICKLKLKIFKLEKGSKIGPRNWGPILAIPARGRQGLEGQEHKAILQYVTDLKRESVSKQKQMKDFSSCSLGLSVPSLQMGMAGSPAWGHLKVKWYSQALVGHAVSATWSNCPSLAPLSHTDFYSAMPFSFDMPFLPGFKYHLQIH